ncbi:alpha/beta hydrolase [Vibrio sp. M60_M31a]
MQWFVFISEQEKIKALRCDGRALHTDLFTSSQKLQQMPKMYLDCIGITIRKSAVDINSMAGQMKAWSLKVQAF